MGQIQYQLQTKIGPLYLTAAKNRLDSVSFQKQNIKLIKVLDSLNPQEKVLMFAVKQLKEYFDGKRKKFTIILDFPGTAFQKKVWRQLMKVPFGKTVSYRDIAQKIKAPKAFRAVGTANGKNPFCIIVPCHRVIAADGSIGGYTGGIEIKRWLLKFEESCR